LEPGNWLTRLSACLKVLLVDVFLRWFLLQKFRLTSAVGIFIALFCGRHDF